MHHQACPQQGGIPVWGSQCIIGRMPSARRHPRCCVPWHLGIKDHKPGTHHLVGKPMHHRALVTRGRALPLRASPWLRTVFLTRCTLRRVGKPKHHRGSIMKGRLISTTITSTTSRCKFFPGIASSISHETPASPRHRSINQRVLFFTSIQGQKDQDCPIELCFAR
jgi:hypothetical protein